MVIKLKKLSGDAVLPTRATANDAGYDLYATEDYVLQPLERKLFKTNIAIAIPKGYYGRIAPRSGLAYKNGIDVLAGVIDSSYRNDVGVILINLNAPELKQMELNLTPMEKVMQKVNEKKIVPKEFTIKKGDRIAQIIIEKCHAAEWQEVESLDETERGQGGFGSTGQ